MVRGIKSVIEIKKWFYKKITRKIDFVKSNLRIKIGSALPKNKE